MIYGSLPWNNEALEIKECLKVRKYSYPVITCTINSFIQNFQKDLDPPTLNILNVPIPLSIRDSLRRMCSICPHRRPTARELLVRSWNRGQIGYLLNKGIRVVEINHQISIYGCSLLFQDSGVFSPQSSVLIKAISTPTSSIKHSDNRRQDSQVNDLLEKGMINSQANPLKSPQIPQNTAEVSPVQVVKEPEAVDLNVATHKMKIREHLKMMNIEQDRSDQKQQ